jgi:hypothetical protein
MKRKGFAVFLENLVADDFLMPLLLIVKINLSNREKRHCAARKLKIK